METDMPRASQGAESTEPTREWRKRNKAERRPETDAVDTALAAAVTVYRHTAEKQASDRDRRRASALEMMAINYLVTRGYAHDQAERQVRRRVRRLGVEKLIPMVNGSSFSPSR
jgi:hypothetical protein